MNRPTSPPRVLAVALAALLALAACDGSPSGTDGPPLPASEACTSLGRTAQRVAVAVPERGTGAALEGALFALAQPAGSLPVVSMLPGGGAGISSVEWAACALASHGYVVVVTRPSAGASTAAYHTAAVSGIDFLASAANPFRAASDTERVGVAGWSLGARSLTRTQAEDTRVDALVAWDNLAVSETGDAGSPACSNQPGPVRAPRVPALGQASDTCTDRPADAKKTAFAAWRAAGVPAMQVVFGGATHFLWSAQGGDAPHALSHHYTVAWFDRWLKGDAGATQRLLARSVDGRSAETTLSTRFRSAAFLDGRNCDDLRAGC
jgi:dienelactone hydrolase